MNQTKDTVGAQKRRKSIIKDIKGTLEKELEDPIIASKYFHSLKYFLLLKYLCYQLIYGDYMLDSNTNVFLQTANISNVTSVATYQSGGTYVDIHGSNLHLIDSPTIVLQIHGIELNEVSSNFFFCRMHKSYI